MREKGRGSEAMKTYKLGKKTITCLICGTESNIKEERELRYCETCHAFHKDIARGIEMREKAKKDAAIQRRQRRPVYIDSGSVLGALLVRYVKHRDLIIAKFENQSRDFVEGWIKDQIDFKLVEHP